MKKTPKGGGKGAKGEKLYTPVSQATIDKIKKMGMTAALAKAGKTSKGANAEFVQGVTRMYGAKRVAAARAKAAPAAKSADAARAAAMKKPVAKKVAKSPDEARTMASKAKPAAKKASTTTKYTYRNPKPVNLKKGLFPGLLGGKK